MSKVAGVIVNLVPYHHARWERFALHHVDETNLISVTDKDPFSVLEFSGRAAYKLSILFPKTDKDKISFKQIRKAIIKHFESFPPSVICVSGWGLPVSLAAIYWASNNGVPIVMLSESNQFDEARSTIKEWIKRRLVGLCSAGLAGGSPQAEYLVKLGLPIERVFVGYDVVDNRYFAERSEELGARSLDLGETKRPFFLACARFGKKKNLPGLIRAYSRYREKTLHSTLDCRPSTLFDLVIAGDGEGRAEIERTIRECGNSDYVHLVGAKGYTELPSYYAQAGAFIHASTTEQWGLVVNEAMASGLPVLVSNRCGCAADLVKEGENGWTFDPTNEEQMADLLLRISNDEETRVRMGARSREIIAEWGPERFASGVKAAVDAALAAPKKKVGLLDRLILNLLTRK